MNKSLYCFCCCLFLKTKKHKSSLAKKTGFPKFWKLNSKIPEHENSPDNQRVFKELKMLKMTLNKGKTLDSKSQEQTMKQRQIWRQVLTWLLNIMKFLTKQNLPFRGHQDDVHSSNKSNFVELLKLMSQYDPVLGKHYLKEVNDNQWYLSPKIQNKFIHILGNHMKENILDQNQKANYFVIILNSMPDISHTDQMSFICQYAIVEDKEVEVWESFLGFITDHGKTAYNIKK